MARKITTEGYVVEKTLLPGEQRFEVREKSTSPRIKIFEVYDKATGSFPIYRPETGAVKSSTNRPEADAECARLEQIYKEAK